jgi:hypothetical protein
MIMSSKIEIKIGNLSFSGEGEEKWLSSEFDKVLDKIGKKIDIDKIEDENYNGEINSEISKKALATFLKEKNAETNQNDKFLVTAVWLNSKGNDKIKTNDVTKALKDNHQKRLGNPTECLRQNISKGFCEKYGNQFFVTEEGKKSIGIIKII